MPSSRMGRLPAQPVGRVELWETRHALDRRISSLNPTCVLPVLLILLLVQSHVLYAAAQQGASPPAPLEMQFEPARPQTGDSLKLKVSLAQETSRAQVEWFVNDENVLTTDATGQEPLVELGVPLKAGDRIRAVVTPYDFAGDAGRALTQEVRVANASPHMELLDQKITQNVYSARIKATDPDGDPVSLNLVEGPKGMTIEKDGAISWKIPENTDGRFEVRISATDGKGGETVLSYSFGLKKPTKATR
ncbi:MAG: Ig domain-containing protein [Thermodesulfobacteriota bacterium]